MFIADDNILGRLENDEKAFKELVDAYYTPLCVYSVQFTDSLEVSEDIVQDFFVRFWEKKLYRTYIMDVNPDDEVPEEQLARLRHYLQQLSPQEYRILMEVVVHNKKYKEVAAELGISVNTVKTHLSHALKYLRSCKFITLFSLFSL